MPHVGRLKRGLFKELDEKGGTASKSGKEASKRISSAPFLQRWRRRGKNSKKSNRGGEGARTVRNQVVEEKRQEQ